VARWPGGGINNDKTLVRGWPDGPVARWPGGPVRGWPGGPVARWPGGPVARWPGGPVRGWPGRTGLKYIRLLSGDKSLIIFCGLIRYKNLV
jgi:hypothetical protein